ncbi:MAG: type I methionyl aminopeptidase [Firmicutes bacterium]|jgi:methionyl aminopeptidase|nr:type I methionyl aminopeptidase [Bacillota bacterium]MEE3382353.1 type I methionyl aminopeptidase [Anaerovoracaceae bacterium]MBQ1431167.1 type I methionyl aminopeptidase [Bacillota bacterium]MBQ1630234.1 type I methionyl aminopeptidase [Bacillota bacterium]MBQ1715740.1 type I methionyl aminopeptidase [Bacillota bacterium]
MIVIKSEHEIRLMREAGKVCSLIFKRLEDLIKPGISTKDIDDLVEKTVKEHGMKAAEKGYYGYPASVCTSVNEEVVHGIPSKDRILREGDIVSCDLVVENKGYMADACRTYGVGQISEEAQHLIDTAEKAFFNGIKNAVPGKRLRDISREVQNTVEGEGFGVIRDYVGHGIGSEMHEDPQIPNYVCPGPNPRMQKGMTIAVEPMICQGDWEVEVLDDDWTAVTVDGGWAAHYENTIVVTDGEPEIITL